MTPTLKALANQNVCWPENGKTRASFFLFCAHNITLKKHRIILRVWLKIDYSIFGFSYKRKADGLLQVVSSPPSLIACRRTLTAIGCESLFPKRLITSGLNAMCPVRRRVRPPAMHFVQLSSLVCVL